MLGGSIRMLMLMRAIKTRCSGTLTECAFWGTVRSALRRISVRWKPRADYMISVRRASQNANRKLKYEYPCELCEGWFAREEVEADHRVPWGDLGLGPLCEANAGKYINWLLAEEYGWRSLCKTCHKKVTKIGRQKQ